jgi:hypothetical protein
MKDLLTELGGLGQTLFVILELTNMVLGRQLFLRKIIGDLYLMKKHDSTEKDYMLERESNQKILRNSINP